MELPLDRDVVYLLVQHSRVDPSSNNNYCLREERFRGDHNITILLLQRSSSMLFLQILEMFISIIFKYTA